MSTGRWRPVFIGFDLLTFFKMCPKMGTRYPVLINTPNPQPPPLITPYTEIFFGQIFGHQKTKIDARDTKRKRGHKTPHITAHARYEELCRLFFFSKSSENLIFVLIFGHQKAEKDARNTKMNRGQETHPMTANARHEMYWANIFFHKVPETSFSAKYLATEKTRLWAETRNWIGSINAPHKGKYQLWTELRQ